MRAKSRLFLFTVFLSIILLLTGCTNPDRAVNGNPKTEDTAGVINDNSGSYSEDEGRIDEPSPSAAETGDNESQDPTGDDTGPDMEDETAGNGETQETKNSSGNNGEILRINGLVRVQDIDPDIVVELRYATENNFTGRIVYPHDVCVLRESTAIKLANANRELMEMGYRIKVWDAYRPVYVQRIFWEIVPDSRYVANPDKGGSKHNRGTAVDVTLVDMEGNELEMPSGFDDFTGKGSRNGKNMSETARKNMELLTDVMVRNGFTTISTEWWHFNDSDSDKYEIIDVNLEEFLKDSVSGNGRDAESWLLVAALDKLKDVAGDSEQIVFVCADSLGTSRAEVHTFEKNNGRWEKVFEPMKAVIGSGGFSYDKKEGDKKSPVGAFLLKRSFGRYENPGTRLVYTRFSQGDFWVDDANSPYYNTYQKGPANGRWNSAEDLYGIGDPYKYFIVIEYNTEEPVAGKGSAIFFHIWRNENSPTAGCTAVSEENILKIMKWLDPSRKPLILQYPADHLREIAN